MEELEEDLKELKGFATPAEVQYQPTKHMEGPMSTSEFVPEDYLIWHQWEECPLVLWRVDDQLVENARALS